MTARELPNLRLEIEIVLRLARQDDLTKLEWYGQYAHFRPLFQRAFKEQQEGRRWMLLADCNGFPIGQLFVQLVSAEEEIADGVSRGYLYALRVMEMFRGQGIGTRLVEAAESRLAGDGYQWATIAVAKENAAARRLYERMGYQIFRDDPGEWRYRDHQGKARNVREPCWIMEKPLI
jgi:ribosomal protein S18 acetylase RimI-like enzyme